jgi:hypothetical protein
VNHRERVVTLIIIETGLGRRTRDKFGRNLFTVQMVAGIEVA